MKTDPVSSRRQLLSAIGIGSVSATLPSKWTRPLVESVILPAHAQTTTGNNDGNDVEDGVENSIECPASVGSVPDRLTAKLRLWADGEFDASQNTIWISFDGCTTLLLDRDQDNSPPTDEDVILGLTVGDERQFKVQRPATSAWNIESGINLSLDLHELGSYDIGLSRTKPDGTGYSAGLRFTTDWGILFLDEVFFEDQLKVTAVNIQQVP